MGVGSGYAPRPLPIALRVRCQFPVMTHCPVQTLGTCSQRSSTCGGQHAGGCWQRQLEPSSMACLKGRCEAASHTAAVAARIWSQESWRAAPRTDTTQCRTQVPAVCGSYQGVQGEEGRSSKGSPPLKQAAALLWDALVRVEQVLGGRPVVLVPPGPSQYLELVMPAPHKALIQHSAALAIACFGLAGLIFASTRAHAWVLRIM